MRRANQMETLWAKNGRTAMGVSRQLKGDDPSLSVHRRKVSGQGRPPGRPSQGWPQQHGTIGAVALGYTVRYIPFDISQGLIEVSSPLERHTGASVHWPHHEVVAEPAEFSAYRHLGLPAASQHPVALATSIKNVLARA
jgi:hypothetical protein